MIEAEWLACDDPARMLEFASGRMSLRDWSGPFPQVSGRKHRLFACAAWRWRDVRNASAHEGFPDCPDVAESLADGLPMTTGIPPAPNADYWGPLRPDAVEAARHMLADRSDPEERLVQATIIRDIVGNPFRPYAAVGGPNGLLSMPKVLPNGTQKFRHDWLTPATRGLAERAYGGRSACPSCDGQGGWGSSAGKRGGPGGQMVTPCRACGGEGFADTPFDAMLLPILADALEDAGCTDEVILRHLHGGERCPHCLAGRDMVARIGGLIRTAKARGAKATIGSAAVACSECEDGWIKLRGPHARGCWVLDLVLGKE